MEKLAARKIPKQSHLLPKRFDRKTVLSNSTAVARSNRNRYNPDCRSPLNYLTHMKYTKLILPVVALAVACTPANAAVLAFFVDGTDADAAALANKADVSPLFTVSALSNVGFAGTTNITRNEFGTANPTTPAGSVAGSSAGSEYLFQRSSQTIAEPGTTTDYYGFTITGNGGNTIDLTSIRFNFVAAVNDEGDGILGNESLTALSQVFASVNGGTFNAIGLAVTAFDDDADNAFGTVQTANVDLSGITGANSVEIRIGVGDDAGSQNRASFIQGIELNGIPEPSSSALLVSALSLLALRRRR